MSELSSQNCTSNTNHADQLSEQKQTIGQLFQDYSEQYIKQFKPRKDQIDLIRSIRICGTPYLGAAKYTCKSCGNEHHVYLHCGNSHCMLCQSFKRMKWQANLSARLYKVPYVHSTFTLPKNLRGLAKRNPKEIYNILFKSAWSSIQKVGEKLNCQMGMIAVLHT